MVHLCRSAHELGWLIAKNDFTNGFNSLSRQAMLDAHSIFFPENTSLFSFFYAVDAPIFFFDEDSNLISLQTNRGPGKDVQPGMGAVRVA